MSVLENCLFAKIMFVFVVVLIIICGSDARECGVRTKKNAAPWQVGIFERTVEEPFLVWLCGGTLISHDVVLTAAHLLWVDEENENTDLKKNIVVAAGNFSKTWIDSSNTTKKSDVSVLTLSPEFRQEGLNANPHYIDDIAVLVVTEPFPFDDYIYPACVDFDLSFQDKLREQSIGSAASWNDMKDKFPKQHVKDLYYVSSGTCGNDKSSNSRGSTTTLLLDNKFCVDAKQDSSAICNGDSGIGITFIKNEDGVDRHYLRGVLSGPLDATKTCTIETYYTFTSVTNYSPLIGQYWNDTEPEIPEKIGKCVMPAYPNHGTYSVEKMTQDVSEDEYIVVNLTVNCDPGYGVIGQNSIVCYSGYWPEKMVPKCVQTCHLKPHPSVEYRCLVSGNEMGYMACRLHEPVGTVVNPVCRLPDFYAASDLPFMRCLDGGNWDYVAKCKAECGRRTAKNTVLAAGGVNAKKGELPWHVGIYSKSSTPYMQICGGSLISKDLVISAAHCFWMNQLQNATDYAVAAGKIYRPWNDKVDEAQKSDVKEIKVPIKYQDSIASFQDDIAVVILKDPFTYMSHVRPVCLNFEHSFDKLQLRTGNSGKVAGWGLLSADGNKALTLQVLHMPYVDEGTCLKNSPKDFIQYITNDKICAGVNNNKTALCKGDSGGGLAFPSDDRGVERHYLRGIVSSAPKSDSACNLDTYTAFTQITKHEDFIRAYLNDL